MHRTIADKMSSYDPVVLGPLHTALITNMRQPMTDSVAGEGSGTCSTWK